MKILNIIFTIFINSSVIYYIVQPLLMKSDTLDTNKYNF